MTELDDRRWQAVAVRDGGARQDFIIAVRTTKIYCRPGCPARMPLRQNVCFFDSTEAARAAGFRACKRCHPDR
jgi:AraC family transcriptional regulator of adaptative response/methylated-DNA-[protein]-cysteine methyltransferase